MISKVSIKNFKSVYDLELELGQFNVLIGENGCGKSNILEAIAFGAAASADKLDYEFLGSRGIRLSNPEYMISAFSKNEKKRGIDITFIQENKEFNYTLENDSINPKKWINRNKVEANKIINRVLKDVVFNNNKKEEAQIAQELDLNLDELKQLTKIFSFLNTEKEKLKFMSIYPKLIDHLINIPDISNFIIYSPEQTSLRKFEETTQIYPLGIRGEGIFQYLKELAFDSKNERQLQSIKKTLSLLDWYEDFKLPENLLKNEFSLRIKDRYLEPSLQYFDQRSTNEGFLYLLFYATLFISKETPSFFAIDNIDASFNPKLCKEVIQTFVSLTKKNKKQLIVTTQNPAVLDGINLKDDSQRLFVISRNFEGHTKARRIEHQVNRDMELSEAWKRGLIGGLPDNF